jgi:hypothetical protein
LLLASLAVGIAACSPVPGPASSASPAGHPSGPPVLGLDWAEAQSVEGPSNFQETLPPDFHQDHPILRFPGQAIMSDVLGLPGGGAVAVGYVPPDWTPVAWSSLDGLTWQLHLLGDSDFTFPVALSARSDGMVVAVGRSRKVPMAWTTRDGITWERHEVEILTDGNAFERMTAVVAGPSAFVAGGSVGPEVGERHARFWLSTDGSHWQPVPDDPEAFANAEVRGISAVGDGFVAVGVTGTTQEPAGALAWTSRDGLRWQRHEGASFSGAIAASIAVAPFGGLVAVGSTVDRREAVTWFSDDGKDWTRPPSEPSRQFGNGYVWMRDVIAIDDVVVGVGDRQGLQRATGTAWVSSDGTTWVRANEAPVLEQSDLYAIATGGPGLLVVGDFGGPDSHVPRAWFSPGR